MDRLSQAAASQRMVKGCFVLPRRSWTLIWRGRTFIWRGLGSQIPMVLRDQGLFGAFGWFYREHQPYLYNLCSTRHWFCRSLATGAFQVKRGDVLHQNSASDIQDWLPFLLISGRGSLLCLLSFTKTAHESGCGIQVALLGPMCDHYFSQAQLASAAVQARWVGTADVAVKTQWGLRH